MDGMTDDAMPDTMIPRGWESCDGPHMVRCTLTGELEQPVGYIQEQHAPGTDAWAMCSLYDWNEVRRGKPGYDAAHPYPHLMVLVDSNAGAIDAGKQGGKE